MFMMVGKADCDVAPVCVETPAPFALLAGLVELVETVVLEPVAFVPPDDVDPLAVAVLLLLLLLLPVEPPAELPVEFPVDVAVGFPAEPPVAFVDVA
jgi:hypothetical protein